MHKQEFLEKLRKGLKGVPAFELEERLAFYSEMIEDRMEEGLSEEEAVSAVGTVEDVSREILSGIPLRKMVKEKWRNKKAMSSGQILCLALGFPLWFSLLISAFCVVLSLFVSLWSVVISFFATIVSLWGGALCAVVACVFLLCTQKAVAALVLFSAAPVCVGLAILLHFGTKLTAKGVWWLMKKTALGTKRLFLRKEESHEI